MKFFKSFLFPKKKAESDFKESKEIPFYSAKELEELLDDKQTYLKNTIPLDLLKSSLDQPFTSSQLISNQTQ